MLSPGIVTVSYIAATILFILALGGLSNQETARRGNWYGITGMTIALLATVFGKVTDNYALLIGAFVPAGAVFGFLGYQGLTLLALYGLGVGFAIFAAWVLKRFVIKGEQSVFVMELPPYRMPTLRGLLIHTWERTWQYIKKAGTVILGFSIILWVMMTFPGPSENQIKFFKDQRKGLTQSFLASPDVMEWVKNEKEVSDLNGLYELTVHTAKENKDIPLADFDKQPFFPLIKAIFFLQDIRFTNQEIDRANLTVATRYISYKNDMSGIDIQEQQSALKGTFAGWIGQRLETITRPLGFDYRTNIALVGGFAAKEIVVSTLGTAYSLGDVDPDEAGSLAERLKNNPDWNPLLAFTLIIFTMLYVPCMVTVIMIRRESSWKWAGFSIGFNLVTAYLISLVISQAGAALGLGG